MKRLVLVSLALGLATLSVAPVQAQRARHAASTTAIVGATVHTGIGEPIANATLVLRDGRIVSIAAGGEVPAGATRVEAPGAIVTAGFVATQAPLGLVEISLESSTRDHAPETHGDSVRASFTAADGYNPASTLIPVARLGGVTSALSTPTGGLIAGTSSWVDLYGATPDETIARATAALHVDLSDGGVEAAGGAMPTALGRLREVLEDARLYGRQRAAYDRRGVRDLHVSRHDLERLQPVLAGRLPVVVRVSRSADILRVLALADDFGLNLVLAGAEEGWRVAAAIAAAEVTVIVEPLTNLPSSFSRLGARLDNAALLQAAGVPVIITTDGAHGLHNLRQEAGNAVAHGMDRVAALAALTSEPARVFGMEDYGTLAPGKVANLVVWSGDPFEFSTRPTHIFVRGVPTPLTSRQLELFRRYRRIESVHRGHPGRPAPEAEAE